MEYKSNHNVVYSCKYHVVWCPKYRRKVLVDGIDTRLKELIKEICNESHIDIIEMEIMPEFNEPKELQNSSTTSPSGWTGNTWNTAYPQDTGRTPADMRHYPIIAARLKQGTVQETGLFEHRTGRTYQYEKSYKTVNKNGQNTEQTAFTSVSRKT